MQGTLQHNKCRKQALQQGLSKIRGKLEHFAKLFPQSSHKSLRSWRSPLQASIRVADFIKNECPVPGLDGRYRERQREATMEAGLLRRASRDLLCPGCHLILPVSAGVLEDVVGDAGLVIIATAASDITHSSDYADEAEAQATANNPDGPLQSGSYAVSAQTLGMQRTALGGFLRLAVDTRVILQAVRDRGKKGQRAQAAPLEDRWAYFVRAAAVQQYCEHMDQHDAKASASSTSHKEGGALRGSSQARGRGSIGTALQGGAQSGRPTAVTAGVMAPSSFGPEVQRAAKNCADVADELRSALCAPLACLQILDMEGQALQLASGSQLTEVVSTDNQRSEVATELEWLLEWCFGGSNSLVAVGANGVSRGPYSWQSMERLSYAPFAAEVSAQTAGISRALLMQRRRKAMEATDLGLRLELAIDLATDLEKGLKQWLSSIGV